MSIMDSDGGMPVEETVQETMPCGEEKPVEEVTKAVEPEAVVELEKIDKPVGEKELAKAELVEEGILVEEKEQVDAVEVVEEPIDEKKPGERKVEEDETTAQNEAEAGAPKQTSQADRVERNDSDSDTGKPPIYISAVPSRSSSEPQSLPRGTPTIPREFAERLTAVLRAAGLGPQSRALTALSEKQLEWSEWAHDHIDMLAGLAEKNGKERWERGRKTEQLREELYQLRSAWRNGGHTIKELEGCIQKHRVALTAAVLVWQDGYSVNYFEEAQELAALQDFVKQSGKLPSNWADILANAEALVDRSRVLANVSALRDDLVLMWAETSPLHQTPLPNDEMPPPKDETPMWEEDRWLLEAKGYHRCQMDQATQGEEAPPTRHQYTLGVGWRRVPNPEHPKWKGRELVRLLRQYGKLEDPRSEWSKAGDDTQHPLSLFHPFNIEQNSGYWQGISEEWDNVPYGFEQPELPSGPVYPSLTQGTAQSSASKRE